MKIIHNKYIPFGKRYLAINLFGIIFTKGDLSVPSIRHEKIHTRQQLELLIIPFYLLYILEWLFRLLQYRNAFQAYKNISFEREAYENMNDESYLEGRKKYAWMKYVS